MTEPIHIENTSAHNLARTLSELVGDKAVFTVHRPFVQFLGSLETAIFFEQVLFAAPKGRTRKGKGWTAMTDKQWIARLFLSRYAIRQAREQLEGRKLIIVEQGVFAGRRSTYYAINWEEFERQWNEWLESRPDPTEELETGDCSDSDNDLSGTRRSNTKPSPKPSLLQDFRKNPAQPSQTQAVRPSSSPKKKTDSGKKEKVAYLKEQVGKLLNISPPPPQPRGSAAYKRDMSAWDTSIGRVLYQTHGDVQEALECYKRAYQRLLGSRCTMANARSLEKTAIAIAGEQKKIPKGRSINALDPARIEQGL